jgi:hypothetical protein
LNIEWVIPCRYVEVHDNLGTIVGAGIDTYWVMELPAPIQVMLAIRLLAMAEELKHDQQHTTKNRVLDPHGELLGEGGGEFSMTGESARPDWLAGLIVPAVVQFQASEEGTYTIEVDVDQASASLPIHVVQGRPLLVPPDEP